MTQLPSLDLENNYIGDPGLAFLAKVCTRGAMANLEELVVDDEIHPELKAACQARGIDLQ